ncbi:MAG: hypothetical protein KJZ93_14695 [Caldilineaceae bacterium]|nr:hypothetical protein [Caldilineaceae bacterium]
MFTIIASYISSLIPQLPVLIILVAGLIFAMRQTAPTSRMARSVVWAFGLLLAHSLLATAITVTLPQLMIDRGATASDLTWIFALVRFVSSLVEALAYGIILAGLLGQGETRHFVRRLGPWIGGLAGLLLGGALGALLGDAIGLALGVTDFEGARGYFVVLAVIPLFALTGAIIGVIAGRTASHQRSSPAEYNNRQET